MKYLRCFLSVTLFCMSCCIMAQDAVIEVDGLKYMIYVSDNRATLCNGSGEAKNESNKYPNVHYAVIPDYVPYNGVSYSVTKIGSYAFLGCENLEFVSIPNTVTEINPSAFQDCVNLTKVNLSNNLQTINRNVFLNCTSLEYLDFPVALNKIDNISSQFEKCTSLTYVIYRGPAPTITKSPTVTTQFTPLTLFPKNVHFYVYSKYKSGYYNVTGTHRHYLDVVDENIVYGFDVALDDNLQIPSDVEIKIEDGAKIQANNGLTISKVINEGYFNFISVPFDCAISDISTRNGLNDSNYGVEWLLKRFDGERHANYGSQSTIPNNTNQYAWVTLSSSDTLKANEGYIIAVGLGSSYVTDGKVTFNFHTPDTTVIEHRHSKLAAQPTSLNDVNAVYYSNESINNAYYGWCLLSTGLLHNLSKGYKLVLDDGTPLKFVNIPNVSDGCKTYSSQMTEEAVLKAYESLMVQLPQSGNVVAMPPVSSVSALVESEEYAVELVLLSNDGEVMDNTTILLADDYTTDYVINSDLRKWRDNSSIQIFSTLDGVDYAFNALPFTSLTEDTLDLSVVVGNYQSEPTYTVSLGDLVLPDSVGDVFIIDRLLDVMVNLSVYGGYTFTVDDNVTAERFGIIFDTQSGSSTLAGQVDSVSYYIENNNIVIESVSPDTQIDLFALNGKLLYSTQCDDSKCVIPTANFVPDVYLLRIANPQSSVLRKVILK